MRFCALLIMTPRQLEQLKSHVGKSPDPNRTNNIPICFPSSLLASAFFLTSLKILPTFLHHFPFSRLTVLLYLVWDYLSPLLPVLSYSTLDNDINITKWERKWAPSSQRRALMHLCRGTKKTLGYLWERITKFVSIMLVMMGDTPCMLYYSY